jgi:hypothetical protein
MEPTYIEFSDGEWYEPHRKKIVWFRATVDEKWIDCGVSLDALRDHFGAPFDDPIPAFRSNRARIEQTAANLIEARRFETDGTIIVRSADLRR